MFLFVAFLNKTCIFYNFPNIEVKCGRPKSSINIIVLKQYLGLPSITPILGKYYFYQKYLNHYVFSI